MNRNIFDHLPEKVTLKCRIGRAGEYAPNWEPWFSDQFHIQKHRGRAVIIALSNIAWAEYGPEDILDITGNVVSLLTEDYYMEVEVPDE